MYTEMHNKRQTENVLWAKKNESVTTGVAKSGVIHSNAHTIDQEKNILVCFFSKYSKEENVLRKLTKRKRQYEKYESNPNKKPRYADPDFCIAPYRDCSWRIR